jgi:hypothetical protein
LLNHQLLHVHSRKQANQQQQKKYSVTMSQNHCSSFKITLLRCLSSAATNRQRQCSSGSGMMKGTIKGGENKLKRRRTRLQGKKNGAPLSPNLVNLKSNTMKNTLQM